ncbi:hypothetical protein P389DRAFT_105875 [Cystobasidium minutum MCA 4210]|uniref:uncharacterized protein n=1 Tax=Cystobasidium minutum MCA 4210 TaxID=1397322 RepID=UPI0034CEC6DD|eukprot:jgi/Rhomi1/105875/CE105874_12354
MSGISRTPSLKSSTGNSKLSNTATSPPGSTSKLFYFHHPTVTRSASTACTSSNRSSSSNSSTSSSASSRPSWSPTLSSITTEESYFSPQRSVPEKSTGLALNRTCNSTCRCTRCCLGDFVFDTEDDYREYSEIIAQARQAGALLDQSAVRTSTVDSVALPTVTSRSSSCPPIPHATAMNK